MYSYHFKTMNWKNDLHLINRCSNVPCVSYLYITKKTPINKDEKPNQDKLLTIYWLLRIFTTLPVTAVNERLLSELRLWNENLPQEVHK